MIIRTKANSVTFDVNYDEAEGILEVFAGDDQQNIWELLCPKTQEAIAEAVENDAWAQHDMRSERMLA